MNKKPMIVEIEDLREFVGGAGEVKVPESSIGHQGGAEAVQSTVMCFVCFSANHTSHGPDAVDDWTEIQRKKNE